MTKKQSFIYVIQKIDSNSSNLAKNELYKKIVSIIGNNKFDPVKFVCWFDQELNFEGVRKPVSYFLAALKVAVANGKFHEISANPQDLNDKAAQLEDLESFEKEVDAWIRIFEDVDDKLYVGAPLSRGIDKYNNVRGVFDGLGGFVYTDGTVSKKYPKLEDLSKEDRDALIVRIDVHHRGLPGHDDIVALVKGAVSRCNE